MDDLTIITGGRGSGKTTRLVKAFLDAKKRYRHGSERVVLIVPTLDIGRSMVDRFSKHVRATEDGMIRLEMSDIVSVEQIKRQSRKLDPGKDVVFMDLAGLYQLMAALTPRRLIMAVRSDETIILNGGRSE